MSTNKAVTIAAPRLPYHPALEERLGVDQSRWRAFVEVIWPNAEKIETVIDAIAYCRARNLDPMKRVVHIVKTYDSKTKRYVESIWPGIAELRTTAFRTGAYGGADPTEWGPESSKVFQTEEGQKTVIFPEWARITLYRIVAGQRVAFPGPTVYWAESFSAGKGGAPNMMWSKRPRAQLEKCAEAAALRKAFPEEIGGDLTVDEAPSAMVIEGEVSPPSAAPARPELKPMTKEVLHAWIGDAGKESLEPTLNEDLAEAEAALEEAVAVPGEEWELWRDQVLLNLQNAPTVGHVNKALKAAAEDFEDAPPEMVSAVEDAAEARLAYLKNGAAS